MYITLYLSGVHHHNLTSVSLQGCPLQCSGLENSMDYSPWSHKASDTTEQLSLHFIHYKIITTQGLVIIHSHIISSIELLSHVRRFAVPWTAALQASCPSPTPRARSNSCPSSRSCYPTISSSVIPFSSCLQSFRLAKKFT